MKQNCSRQWKKLSKPEIQEESQNKILKKIRNLFRLEKENKSIEGEIIRDIKKKFEQEVD